MTHRSKDRIKADREAREFGAKTIEAVKAGDSERAGALATFAVRWAKRSMGWTKH